jgi:hypothetical protein
MLVYRLLKGGKDCIFVSVSTILRLGRSYHEDGDFKRIHHHRIRRYRQVPKWIVSNLNIL